MVDSMCEGKRVRWSLVRRAGVDDGAVVAGHQHQVVVREELVHSTGPTQVTPGINKTREECNHCSGNDYFIDLIIIVAAHTIIVIQDVPAAVNGNKHSITGVR